MSSRPLVMIPTYNERDNVERICGDILALSIELDILFVDDNSPDGTGPVLDALAARHANVRVLHRSGKLGIGSAHLAGIDWAYRQGYQLLVTMDCDYTHPPEYIPRFLELAGSHDVAVGSRYMLKTSLSEWNLFRKGLTLLGHFLTRNLLGMPYDATGAYRAYRLDRIPRQTFDLVHSLGYSFFFESLYILFRNQHSVVEIPIMLPARTYGHSKMSYREAIRSALRLFHIYFTSLLSPEAFEAPRRFLPAAPSPADTTEGWDGYWHSKKRAGGLVYDLIAMFYRKFIIKPNLGRFFARHFDARSDVVHAGCGSGQVDTDLNQRFTITALDISPNALSIYERVNKNNPRLMLGDIFALPFDSESRDGIYNLGVMEHFTEEDIQRILGEFHRVLKPGGKVLIFWPPEYGLSVIFLKFVHFVLNRVLKKNIQLHPDEITRIQSRKHAYRIFEQAKFTVVDYSFGPRDAFTYAVIVATKAP